MCISPRSFRGAPVPCGNCVECEERERWSWRERMRLEMRKAARTWFLTLTFRGGAPERSALRDEYQEFIKRLRAAGVSLRHVAVFERGERRGRLHMHALIHCDASVTRRMVERKWSMGFSKCKLAADRHAAYVCKYLTKDKADGRILASQKYGRMPEGPVKALIDAGFVVLGVKGYRRDASGNRKVLPNGVMERCRDVVKDALKERVSDWLSELRETETQDFKVQRETMIRNRLLTAQRRAKRAAARAVGGSSQDPAASGSVEGGTR